MRQQFAGDEQATVTVADEMGVVRDYVALLRLQMGARLAYVEHVDPRTLSMSLPTFSIQLLVENAIKHGLGRDPRPGTISVDIGLDGTALRVDVRNSGRLGERASGGSGLDNLERRLALLFGVGSGLQLSQQGDAVLARLCVGAPR